MLMPEIVLDIGTNYYEVAKEKKITSLDAALEMISVAARIEGVTALKFQWYNADTLVRKDAPAYWPTKKTQYEIFSQQDQFGFDEYAKLKEHCDKVGIEFMCTAFDLDILEKLNPLVKRHKIASADITFQPFLEQVASYGKPVMISTGGARMTADINRAIESLLQSKSVNTYANTTLLHCVLNYPTNIVEAYLNKILELKIAYNLNVGYSDHCIYDRFVLITAWLMGAKVIEKHFTLSHDYEGNDHVHAATPDQVREWIATMKTVKKMIEGVPDESQARKLARRGVYLKQDVKAGEVMSIEHVNFLRPQNNGLTPSQFIEECELMHFYFKQMKAGEQL